MLSPGIHTLISIHCIQLPATLISMCYSIIAAPSRKTQPEINFLSCYMVTLMQVTQQGLSNHQLHILFWLDLDANKLNLVLFDYMWPLTLFTFVNPIKVRTQFKWIGHMTEKLCPVFWMVSSVRMLPPRAGSKWVDKDQNQKNIFLNAFWAFFTPGGNHFKFWLWLKVRNF